MGTPDFCLPTLKSLNEDPEIDLSLVISQPDAPRGRKMKLQPSPVKAFCLENRIPVETPDKVSSSDWIEKIKSYEFDAVVVLAYGQLLKQSLLDVCPDKFLNIHASLLPRWRGAAPIQRAIMEGDVETGLSVQIMRLKLDAGPVVYEEKTKILENESSIDLAERLSLLSSKFIAQVVKDHVEGATQAKEQDESLVTYAKKISKEESLINFNDAAMDVHNKIRGLQWGPGAYTFYNEKRLKLSQTSVDKSLKAPAGEVCRIDPEKIWIGTGQGLLGVEVLQPQGKPKMNASDFVNGYALEVGQVLG